MSTFKCFSSAVPASQAIHYLLVCSNDNADIKFMDHEQRTADFKALKINLDPMTFGTFAEIGAGQEVARHFFTVGAAAGTIAKSMSAYDMTFSDEIYGKVGRYVSRERLQAMLEYEYSLLLKRLSQKRGVNSTFFVFADTVAARNFTGTNECHGWLGMRFQAEPLGPPSNVHLHVRLTDTENLLQQQALGIIGVNLAFATFYLRNDPDAFIQSLLDELSIHRIEVDMIEFSGPAFSHIDNRLMALRLVQKGLSDATMFAPDGHVLQPSEVVRKRPVLLQRGSFRPVTHVNIDMLRGAQEQFLKIPKVREGDPVILFELTIHNLSKTGSLDEQDFLARADSISALGHTVMVSAYSEFYKLTSFFRRYTKEPIGMAVGINALMQILEPKFYVNLEGGILEALGKLFAEGLKLFVYPMTRDGYLRYCRKENEELSSKDASEVPEVIGAGDILMDHELEHLYRHLLQAGWIEQIEKVDLEHLSIFSEDVLAQIRAGDPSWEKSVPAPTAAIIKRTGLFTQRPHLENGAAAVPDAKTAAKQSIPVPA